ALAAEGAKVVVNDLGSAADGVGASNEPADEVAQAIKDAGGDAVACFDTVATMEGGERIIKSAVDSFGRLDILVHAAGILRDRMVFNMTEAEWDLVLAVHLKGMFTTGKHAAILFRQQRSGRMIGFSSTSGIYGNAGQANYGAAKDGIAGFVRTAARDLGKYGVTVNGIAPAAMTRLTATVTQDAREARTRAGISGPLGEGGLPSPSLDPADVAPMVVFLCTDAAKTINGQIFFVQGGQVSLLNNPYASRTMQKAGRWTVEEIAPLFPQTLGKDVVNPAPPQPPKS
ncbi:MAG: SDR family oxidoreductase, partial [Dehalococcoidia bacterium]